MHTYIHTHTHTHTRTHTHTQLHTLTTGNRETWQGTEDWSCSKANVRRCHANYSDNMFEVHQHNKAKTANAINA